MTPQRTDDGQHVFSFLKINECAGKPREQGITEIRGPYYSVMGRRYLEDVLGNDGRLRGRAQVRRRLVRDHAGARREGG